MNIIYNKKPLLKHHIETINALRKADKRFESVPDTVLALTWHKFSEDYRGGSWASVDDKTVRLFIRWSFITPIRASYEHLGLEEKLREQTTQLRE